MKPKKTKTIVFADLDGTLLDKNYDCAEVKPIIRQLLSLSVSIILCSSKTKSEIEFFRKELAISDPFIVENGSAILVPENYFKTSYEYSKQTKGYHIIELGCDYSTIRAKLVLVKERTGASIVGFGDMNPEEIAKESGLPLRLARLAKNREYDEPFKIVKGGEKEILREIINEGLCYTKGGRYIHILGNTDKGKAVIILKNIYSQTFSKITTIGVGDAQNDLPMLKVVDKPFWLGKKAHTNTHNNVWQKILSSAIICDCQRTSTNH